MDEVFQQIFRFSDMLLECMSFVATTFVCLIWVNSYFSSFHVKTFSHSTSITEYCVFYSGVLCLQATSFSGYTWEIVNFFSTPSMLLYC